MFNQKQILQKGTVKYINGDRATVEIAKLNPEECKSCTVCTDIKNKPNLLEVNVIPGLCVGHKVTLQITEHSPYKSIFFLLFLPVISLLIGSLIGKKVQFIYPNSQDIRMVFCGFVFFLLSIVFVSIYDRMIRNKKQKHRKIILIENMVIP